MTQIEIILKAALALGNADCRSFSREALGVECFKISPDVFSLKGFPQHPNVNKAWASLSKKDGPVASGYLEPVGSGWYRLTAKGLRRANGTPGPDSGLAPNDQQRLETAMASMTWKRLYTGRHRENVTLSDAAEWLGDIAAWRACLDRVEMAVDVGEVYVAAGQVEHVTQAVVNCLKNATDWLVGKYEKRLEMQTKRKVSA